MNFIKKIKIMSFIMIIFSIVSCGNVSADYNLTEENKKEIQKIINESLNEEKQLTEKNKEEIQEIIDKSLSKEKKGIIDLSKDGLSVVATASGVVIGLITLFGMLNFIRDIKSQEDHKKDINEAKKDINESKDEYTKLKKSMKYKLEDIEKKSSTLEDDIGKMNKNYEKLEQKIKSNLDEAKKDINEAKKDINEAKKDINESKDEYTKLKNSMKDETDNLKSTLYEQIGDGYISLGNYKEAVKNYEEAIKLNTDNLGLYYKIGHEKEKLANYGRGVLPADKKYLYEALEYYEKLRNLDEKNILAYIGISSILKKINKIDEAIENCELAIKLEPNNIALQNELAYLYKINGQKEKSKTIYEEIINMNVNYIKRSKRESNDEIRENITNPNNIDAYLGMCSLYDNTIDEYDSLKEMLNYLYLGLVENKRYNINLLQLYCVTNLLEDNYRNFKVDDKDSYIKLKRILDEWIDNFLYYENNIIENIHLKNYYELHIDYFIGKKSVDYSELIARLIMIRGMVCYNMGYYKNSIVDFIKVKQSSFNISTKQNFIIHGYTYDEIMIDLNNNIGFSLCKLEKYKEAIRYYDEAILFAESKILKDDELRNSDYMYLISEENYIEKQMIHVYCNRAFAKISYIEQVRNNNPKIYDIISLQMNRSAQIDCEEAILLFDKSFAEYDFMYTKALSRKAKLKLLEAEYYRINLNKSINELKDIYSESLNIFEEALDKDEKIKKNFKSSELEHMAYLYTLDDGIIAEIKKDRRYIKSIINK